MAAPPPHYQVGEMDSGPTDSLSSTPRSDHHHLLHDDGAAAAQQPRFRFMCSFGGKIIPRPHDNQLRYVGGDTRIVVVNRHTSFASLLTKLSKLAGTANISIKYQLPNEDLDALITVTADEDVENMLEEYDRLSQNKSPRLRLFLFNLDDTSSRTSSISSLLDGSAKRESWFVDALNGGQASGPILDRGRSEVSSIVSEVPDYLFGLDNQDEVIKEPKIRNKHLLNDSVSMSDPGSPAPVVSSPFGSTSSSLAPPHVQAIPDLPPLKTKPVNPVQTMDLVKESRVGLELGHEMLVDNTGPPQAPVYSSGPGPMWHYPGPAMQPVQAVYYVPGGHQVQPANISVQPVPMQAQFVQPYPVVPSQVPVGFRQTVSNMGQVYGASVRPYDLNSRVVHDGVNQAMYFAQGVRNAVVPGSYRAMVGSGVDEIQGFELDVAGQGQLPLGR